MPPRIRAGSMPDVSPGIDYVGGRQELNSRGDDERLTRSLVNALKDTGSLQPPPAPMPTSVTGGALPNSSVTFFDRVTWTGMPKYTGKCDTVDVWFTHFEGRMHTARIPAEKWVEKLLECPGFRPETKQRFFVAGLIDGSVSLGSPATPYGVSSFPMNTPGGIPEQFSAQREELDSLRGARGEKLAGYQLNRRFLLRSDGPLYPTGYFMDRIHSVQGSTQEDVLEALEQWFCSYKKAA